MLTRETGIVADDADKRTTFHTTTPYGHAHGLASSFSSAAGEPGSAGVDPFDFSYYMDQVRTVLRPEWCRQC